MCEGRDSDNVYGRSSLNCPVLRGLCRTIFFSSLKNLLYSLRNKDQPMWNYSDGDNLFRTTVKSFRDWVLLSALRVFASCKLSYTLSWVQMTPLKFSYEVDILFLANWKVCKAGKWCNNFFTVFLKKQLHFIYFFFLNISRGEILFIFTD